MIGVPQMVIEFYNKYWQLFATFLPVFMYIYLQIVSVRRGIRALIRADLIRLYNKYHDDLGYCPLYVKQALEEEYKQYHVLKGNGVGTEIYEKLMALPTEPPEKKG